MVAKGMALVLLDNSARRGKVLSPRARGSQFTVNNDSTLARSQARAKENPPRDLLQVVSK
jgi:hypothetical protein